MAVSDDASSTRAARSASKKAPARGSKSAAGTPAKNKAPASASKSAKSTGKRGRNEGVVHLDSENKKAKGKLLSEDEEEENVMKLKSLSSINGLEISGEGINMTNDKGETYLHFAAFKAQPQLVKWLIEKGADCNMQDEKGKTALSRCASGDHQCVRFLLQAGADVDLADKDGISPLHYASLSSSYENVNLMLQHEAHVNTFDKINGSSPLHDACFSGSLKCVKALVEAGANVNMHTKSTKDKNKGAVALHYAAQENRHDIVEYLIRKSAGVNIQDARGCTPLHYAAYKGSGDAVRVLLQNKADKDRTNHDGNTAAKLMQTSQMVDKESKARMLEMLHGAPSQGKQGGCVIC
eukprot:Tamp_19073.p1 GENE.Tamp_19073~~Tamp_19073.p1  ORF type:complete len:365 (+),score=95.67 Tamp_19073:40-1095(+)